MNFKCKLQLLLFAFFISFPLHVFAYSNKVILGGDNVGICVESKHILVVGFYEVDGKMIARDSGLSVGDEIVKINNKEVFDIDDMTNAITDSSFDITILRNGDKREVHLDLPNTDNVIKTGIYVKDKISGIGTLTYIDPTTNIFGALGHEIIEQNSQKVLDVDTGQIFASSVTGVTKSKSGFPGEKNAIFDEENVYGKIKNNRESGIFGIYNNNYSNDRYIEIGKSNEIKLGKAQLVTVLENDKIETFDINIINIDKNAKVKNILFEVTDKRLKDATNGIVSGMSGSPIIQNNKLVAAVTHVVVQDPIKGYGIFIETMLKEGDKSKE